MIGVPVDPSIVALLVAGVGVVGTLFAPLIAAITASRGRRQDVELQLKQEKVKLESSTSKEKALELRNCYIGVNMTARAYQSALRSESHAIEAAPDKDISFTLYEHRDAYRTKYAEAQMIVSDEVLKHMGKANSLLAESYGMLMRIAGGNQRVSDSSESLRGLLDGALQSLREMRTQMREDLGVGS